MRKEIKIYYSNNTRETGNYVYDGIENIPDDYMNNYPCVNVLSFHNDDNTSDERICEDMFIYHQAESGKFKLDEEDLNNGVAHTSMMVGDIVEIDDRKYMVDRFGFAKIK